METKLFTFHRIIAACEEGSPEGWLAFLTGYTPIVFQLFDLYLSSSPQRRENFWQEALGTLTANNFEVLKRLEHRAEIEFLGDLHAFLLERGASRLDPAQDSSLAPKPTPDSVSALLKGLPLVHQEVLFFKLRGYSDASLEKLLVITPTVTAKGLERMRADYSALLGRSEDECLWPGAWAQVIRFARAAKQEKCPPLRQFIRLHEGGLSWSDKDPLEHHVADCLHCIERWTALREIKYWRREAKPRPSAEINVLVSSLPLGAARRARKSLLARMFG